MILFMMQKVAILGPASVCISFKSLFYAGVLLPELVTSMVLLLCKAPAAVQSSKAVVMLSSLVDILDKFNRLAPGSEREDAEDLAWPGIFSTTL